MKSNDSIFGFDPSPTSRTYISFPSIMDLIRHVNERQPFCTIKKSEIEPFFRTIYSGWQIFLFTYSASLSRLFFDKLFKNPRLSKIVALAYFRYYLSKLLGNYFSTSS